jgi:ATP-dependent Zn protease
MDVYVIHVSFPGSRLRELQFVPRLQQRPSLIFIRIIDITDAHAGLRQEAIEFPPLLTQ